MNLVSTKVWFSALCIAGACALVGCGDDDTADGTGGSGATSQGGSGNAGGSGATGNEGGTGNAGGGGGEGPGTIPEVAEEAGTFNTLLAAVEAAGLSETLSGPGPFTVFAPTDDAFAEIPQAQLDAILADQELLTAILTYHVIAGEVPASEVVGLTSATTVQGEDISITVEGSSVILNDTVNVTATDVDASNGIIHVIDGVLVPPSLSE